MFTPPEVVSINDREYINLREKWQEAPVASQPGDGARAKPFPWEISGGFGFTNINTNARGARPGATYHNYAENFDCRRPGLYGNSPRIRYIDMSSIVGPVGRGGFRLGGYTNSQLGGGFQTAQTAWLPFATAATPAWSGTAPWVDPENALVDDTTYAEAEVEWNLTAGQQSDIAAQFSFGAVANTSGTSLSLSSTYDYLGLRFPGVAGLAGATIVSAYLTMDFIASGANTLNATIRAQEADAPATFSAAANDISGRALTTASVAWVESITPPDTLTSPDLAAVLQEVVDSYDPSAFVLVLQRVAWDTAVLAWGSAEAARPRLVVTYTAPGGTTTLPLVLTNAAGSHVPTGSPIAGVEYEVRRYAAEGPVSTAATLPGVGENDDSGVAWSNPSNITIGGTSDYASVEVAQSTPTSQILVARDFGFSLPVDASDISVSAQVRSGLNPPSGTSLAEYTLLQLLDGDGNLAGTNLAAAPFAVPGAGSPGTGTTSTYNTFAASLDRDDINSADFGLALRVAWDDPDPFGSGERPRTAYIYWVEVTVTYTTAGAVEDASVRMVVSGTIAGDERAAVGAWPGTATVETYGDPSDLHGEALTAESFNAGGFGIALQAEVTSGAARVEYAAYRVTYLVAGSGGGSLGGGQYVETPQFIQEFSDGNLYVGCGTRTFRLDMLGAVPTVAEVRSHGANARARSAAVFDNQMLVPLGSGADLTVATDPGSSVAPTTWAEASGIRMSNVAVGGGGRAFTSFVNRVYNILPGADPTVAANYLPSVGEVISDETDPVQSLAEYMRGLVAGTVRGLRTFDPDAGYQGRPLVNPVRFSGTQYDGKSLLMLGDNLLYFTRRAVWLFRAGQRPVKTGPELLDQNEGPWRGMEWGVPDYTGDYIIVPGYRPATGDSVIFTLKAREEGEPGIGPMQWSDWLYLEGKECRVVRFWGGTEDYGPKIVFGAGTETVGWIGVGLCGAPDLFCNTITFSQYGKVVGGWDDWGTPGVRKEFDRIEVPVVEHANADNYFQFSISMESEAPFTALPAVTGSGFARILPDAETDLIGRSPALMLEVYQEPDQNVALTIKGTVWVYFSEVPETVQQVTTDFQTKTTRLFDARQEAERLMALVGGQRASFKHLPGNVTYEGRMVDCQAVIASEDAADQGVRQQTYVLRATWRVVPTS